MTLSADLRDRLGAVLRDLGLSNDAGAAAKLLDYLALLQRWNATYNLTAVRDPAQMLTQHLADCLAVIPSLKRQTGDAPTRLLDVGSGGGLPGIVIATMLPHVAVTCVDTVGKKAAFVRQAAAELRLDNLRGEHARVEALWADPFDLIISRAFASLPDFIRLTTKSLKKDGIWLAMKGKYPEAEIANLPSSVEMFHVEQLDVPGLDAERCLIWLRAAPSESP